MGSEPDLSLRSDATAMPPDANETRLHGWRLVLARVVALTSLAAIAALYVLTLPTAPHLVAHPVIPCYAAGHLCAVGPRTTAFLARFGISLPAVALTNAAMPYVGALMAGGIVAVLLWQRSDDWMALLVALTLALLPITYASVLWDLSGSWQIVPAVVTPISTLAQCLLLATFPNGRFVSRWLWVPVLAMPILSLPAKSLPVNISFSILEPLIIACMVLLTGSLIYRCWRTSNPVYRQQIKWVMYGIVLTFLIFQVFLLPLTFIPASQQPDAPFLLLWIPVSLLLVVIIPITLAIAILRYHLYDIDLLINRTLVYGSLTAILAVVYFGVVYGAQSLIGRVNVAAADSPVIVVGTTLLIAALFTPLRRRLQAVIDQRFYRRKYDAAKTLATFALTLRDETDLGTVCGRLLAVVDDTMRPARVSLWLAPTRLAPARSSDDEAPLRRSNERDGASA